MSSGAYRHQQAAAGQYGLPNQLAARCRSHHPFSFMDILGFAWVLSITAHYIHFRSPDARTVAKD